MAHCRVQTREEDKITLRGLHVFRHRKRTKGLECSFTLYERRKEVRPAAARDWKQDSGIGSDLPGLGSSVLPRGILRAEARYA